MKRLARWPWWLAIILAGNLSLPASSSPLSGLFGGDVETGQAEEEFLPADKAFSPPRLEIEDSGILQLYWQVAEGYYLYRDRFQFRLEGNQEPELEARFRERPCAVLGPAQIPPGVEKDEGDDSGPVQVFYREATVTLPIIRYAPSADGAEGHDAIETLRLIVGYQGCAEGGLCYPPITKTLLVDGCQD